jgi:chromosome condensin MukBEF MukE localization factor
MHLITRLDGSLSRFLCYGPSIRITAWSFFAKRERFASTFFEVSIFLNVHALVLVIYSLACDIYIYIYIYPNRLYHVGIIPDELLKLLDQIMKVVWLLYGPDTGPDDLEEIQQEVRLHALIHILVYLYSDLTYIIRVCPYV